MNKNSYKYLLFVFATVIGLTYGCNDNFPNDYNAFSLDMNFTQQTYSPVLGRNTVFEGNFNSGESSKPLSFKISAVRTFDGQPAPELLKPFPVSIWKERYTGEEKSLEEIRAKRDTVNRTLWEVGERSGTFTMWESARSNILKSLPDSGYYFDVEVSSSGGRRYFRDLILRPEKERPYSSEAIITDNILGDSTRNPFIPVNVWFNKTGEGSSLSFKMLNPDLSPISLANFGTTDWENLVHGFNKTFAEDSTRVTYDVEYPIPLVPSVQTKYTVGSQAFVEFSYERIGMDGMRTEQTLAFPFSIYERGDWEVTIYFVDEAPLFKND